MAFKLSSETRVGLVVTISLVIVILGINFLRGKNILSGNTALYAFYPDADGLGVSNPVVIHGVKVGQVDEVVLFDSGNSHVRIKFHVEKGTDVPKNSVAKLINSDLLGSKALEIEIGNSTTLVKKYDTLQAGIEGSITDNIQKALAPLQRKVESLVQSVDTVVTGLNDVFSNDTRSNLKFSFASIKRSLSSLETTTGNLDKFVGEESGRLKSILQNVDLITENLVKNNGAITKAINNVSAMSDTLRALQLGQTLREANVALAQVNRVMKKINSGEGTLGSLINDDELYNRLTGASAKLNSLVADIQTNPGRYINLSVIRVERKAKGPVSPVVAP